MRIGDRPTSTPAPEKYETPAEELYQAVLEAFNDSSFLARMALASALEEGSPFERLPPDVRALFEAVVAKMGIGD